MAKFFIPYNDNFQVSPGKWSGYTLILPCVSVGNVPQLTTDLLINSLIKNDSGNDLELVGYIRSVNIQPFAGPDPFTFQGQLFATSIQVFVSNSKKLVIIQQRSPIFKELRNEFYAELSEWINQQSFSLILLLSSSFDHYLSPDAKQDNAFPMNYLASNIDDSLKSFLEGKLGVSSVKPVDAYTMKEDPNGRVHLPGSGSARAYVKVLGTPSQNDPIGPKVVCLVMYCSEGDNRLHSFKYADKVAALVNRNEIVFKRSPNSPLEENGHEQIGKADGQMRFDWTVPFSWRTLFGDEPPQEIF